MKKFIIFLLFFSLFLLSGCGNANNISNIPSSQIISKYPYRDINQEEINHFVPYGYDIIKDDIYKNPKIIKISLDSNQDKNIVLLFSSKNEDIYNEEQNPKMIILKFNRNNDKWEMVNDMYDFKAASISNQYIITNINNDGVEELNLLLTLACGSACSFHQGVFTIIGNKVVDLMPENVTSNMGFRFMDDTKKYLNINYLWPRGESHFGCHYFKVDEYQFIKDSFQLVKTSNTIYRYGLDVGETNELCSIYEENNVLGELGYLKN
ncbi:MAG: hypothetical protein Q7S77_00725 [Candidatus Staskawiczbacteria bacterium]|nr:hypothetical protein [Candidatus Staskawiczbacteria bacterium]